MRLRVGLVGAGLVGQAAHAITLADDRDLFEFAAVVDASTTVRDAIAARYGVPATAASIGEIADLGLDAIVCAVPDPFHRDVCVAALDAGLHVLCEKPLAPTLRECDEIIAARDRAGKIVQVAYMKVYDPSFERFLDLLDDAGALRLLAIEVNDPDQLPFVDHLPMVAPDDLAPELRDELRAATGARIAEALGREPDAAAAKAFDGFTAALVHDVAIAHATLDRLGIPYPPQLAYADAWDAGRAVHLSWRLSGDARCTMTHQNLPGVNDYRERMTAYCDEAIVELVFPSPYLRHQPTTLTVRRSGAGPELIETAYRASYEEAFRNELRAFHASITTGAPVHTGAESARADLSAILDAFRLACA